jgi:hypothetical protein
MNTMIAVMVLAIAATATAQQTNRADSLHQSYERKEQSALAQYGRDLDTVMADMKKKGDLDGVIVLQAEVERFKEERAVPVPSGAKDSVRPAAEAYYRTMVTLLQQYVAALDALVKEEVTADRIEEAKVVRLEKDKMAFMLADMQTKLPVHEVVAAPKTGERAPARPVATAKLKHPEDAQQFGRHWYKAFSEVASWDEAVKRCEDMKGYLACVSDNEENVFIASLTEGRAMWIGATDARKEGKWKWVRGEPFRFNKWFPGQPANDGGNSHYLHIGVPWLSKPEDWNDAPMEFDSVVGFVCEWEQ